MRFVYIFISAALSLILIACAPTMNFATTDVNEDKVEITALMKNCAEEPSLKAIEDEAKYRCARYGRVFEYVSKYCVTLYSGEWCQDVECTYLFSCFKKDTDLTN